MPPIRLLTTALTACLAAGCTPGRWPEGPGTDAGGSHSGGSASGGSDSGGAVGTAPGESNEQKGSLVIDAATFPLRTHELGTEATFSVALKDQPTAKVTVRVVVNDDTEGVVDKLVLQFGPESYRIPQTVTVTGVAEAGLQGDVAYDIQLETASDDPRYSNIPIQYVQVENHDFVVERVSVARPGGSEVGWARFVSLSNGGEAVFFETAFQLVPEDINDTWDVYLVDRVNNAIELISKDESGAAIAVAPPSYGVRVASHPSITPSARY